MSDKTVEKACCGLAEKLGLAKTAELDEELRRPNHRGFKKLAASFGTNHMAVKRHKIGCLGIGGEEGGTAGEQGEQPNRVPPPGGDRGGEHRAPLAALPPPPSARAHASPNDAGSQEERVRYIQGRIADGELCYPDVPTLAREWGLAERTVRAYVAEAYRHVGDDQGVIDERRVLAMAKWDRHLALVDDALDDKPPKRKLSAMDRALLLRERREALTGWCKAAGVFEESKVTVNLAVNPVFVSASEAIFAALAAFPEAASAARRALAARLNQLRQSPLPSSDARTITVEAEQVSAAE